MRSTAHLIEALRARGLQQVEHFASPQPLVSWRGQPLGEGAEVIVRRRAIGATADDLGFQRSSDGTFVALVSEIHLSRFDRRWFAELEKHYQALFQASGGREQTPTPREPEPSAPVPEVASPPRKRQERKPERPAAPSAHAPISPAPATWTDLPATAERELRQGLSESEQAVREGLAAVLSRIEREGKSAGIGCVALFTAWAFVVGIALSNDMGLALPAMATFGAFAIAGKLATKRIRRTSEAAALEFRTRFQHRSAAREEATKRLLALISSAKSERKQILEALYERVRGRN